MDLKQTVDLLQSVLKQQKINETASLEEFTKMKGMIEPLKEELINENFEGTIQEIHVYVMNGLASSNRKELVTHHKLNLARWIEELELLNDGGGQVTIDYEQRKGREI